MTSSGDDFSDDADRDDIAAAILSYVTGPEKVELTAIERYQAQFPDDDVYFSRFRWLDMTLDRILIAAISNDKRLTDEQVRELGMIRYSWMEPGVFYD